MPDNEEPIVETEPTEPTEEALDAELEAELAKFQETEEPVVDAEPAKAEDDKEPEKAELSPEDAAAIISDALDKDPRIRSAIEAKYGKFQLPGESEAEKAGAEVEAKKQTVDEILAGLPDVELDPAVVEAINQRFPGEENQLKRDAMYVRYAAQAGIESAAQKKSEEAVAPIMQERVQAQWEAKAIVEAGNIAAKAEVPEAKEAIAKIIVEAGPDSEERYKTDPQFKAGMDARIKLAVFEVAQSLADDEEKELPTAERVGGGKPTGGSPVDGLTGESKAMAEEYKKDLASGMITKPEYDSFMKDLQKEAARQ